MAFTEFQFEGSVLNLVPLAPAVVALALHYGLYNHGEWHLHGVELILGHAAAGLAVYTLRLTEAAKFLPDLTTTAAIYFATLFTSILTYRLFFHRLNKTGIPGPFLARLSKFWHVWQCRDSRNFLVLDSVVKQYGDFVRTGPSEVTVTHPDVFWDIDGPRSPCSKADWYDITIPTMALVTARDKKVHDTRRRLWDRGFSSKAIREYERRIRVYVRKMEAIIFNDTRAKKATTVSNLVAWFAFDVMGDFMFARSFDMLEHQEWDSVIMLLQQALGYLGPLSPTPWLLQLGFRMFPFLVKPWFNAINWCNRQMKQAVDEVQDGEPTVSYWLIDDARNNGFRPYDWRWLCGDSLLGIVAGSDTVTSTQVGLLCRLAAEPEKTDKLYKELSEVDCSEIKNLESLPYLNGVVNEGLRLHPALLTGGYRRTPKEGAVICGRYIPGETTIVAPRYSIFRREDCFEDANSFIPERWCEKPEMVRNSRCFAPFGTGRYSCVGKVFGLAEMRAVTAELVKKYRFRFATPDTKATFLEATRDCFTARIGRLDLVFSPRD